MTEEYDIVKAFQRIEEELITSMSRNLSRHIKEEKKEGFNWTMWQAEQLNSLKEFKKENPKLFKSCFSGVNKDIENLLRKSFETGQLKQEQEILKALKDNKVKKTKSSFFKINEKKLNALIEEAQTGISKASSSILRYTNDQYRKIIYNAQVYANMGAGTPEKAVDMATKDFLSAGINSIQYSNGARVNITSYAAMAIRTATIRAQMQGEGAERDEFGIHTVLVPNRGGGCPYCSKYQGRVFIDDVWSSGTEKESKEQGYPLLSSAIAGGLFHPNCKDTAVTYFPGINSESTPPTKKELEIKKKNYINDQKAKNIERNIAKYKRLELGSIDEEDVKKYHDKRVAWQEYKKRFKADSEEMFFKQVTKEEKDDIILNDIEKDQITEYTRFDATRINSAIRLNRINDDIQSKIDTIDGAINKTLPLQEDMIVQRGTIIQSFSGFEKMNKVSYDEIMNLKEKIISDRAFISTSKEKAEEQGRNIIMNIKLPKGFKGALDIEEYATPKYKYQKEILLKRNTKFYVKNIEYNQDNKKYYFDVEVVDE